VLILCTPPACIIYVRASSEREFWAYCNFFLSPVLRSGTGSPLAPFPPPLSADLSLPPACSHFWKCFFFRYKFGELTFPPPSRASFPSDFLPGILSLMCRVKRTTSNSPFSLMSLPPLPPAQFPSPIPIAMPSALYQVIASTFPPPFSFGLFRFFLLLAPLLSALSPVAPFRHRSPFFPIVIQTPQKTHVSPFFFVGCS